MTTQTPARPRRSAATTGDPHRVGRTNAVTPQHPPGVRGAATLLTPGLREIVHVVTQLHHVGGVVVVDGPPGVGKTFGARHALGAVDVAVHWVDMPDTPRGKEANARIFRAVTGRRPPPRMTEYALTDETVDVLDGLRAVLVIDEAQNMTRSALRQIRYLHDRPTTTAMVMLIGSDACRTVAQVRELDDRVARRIVVGELTPPQIRRLIPDLHPVFAATSPDVLVTLATHARGSLRQWSRIIEVVTTLGVPADTGITPTTADHIVRAITGKGRHR